MNPNPLNNARIRKINQDDDYEVLAETLHTVAVSGFSGQALWTKKQILHTLEAKNSLVIVADVAEEIVGFIAASKADDIVDVFIVVVAEPYKEKGLGSRLMEYLITWAKAQEMREIILETRRSNHAALALYERVGFEQVGVRKAYYSCPIEDALLLKHEL